MYRARCIVGTGFGRANRFDATRSVRKPHPRMGDILWWCPLPSPISGATVWWLPLMNVGGGGFVSGVVRGDQQDVVVELPRSGQLRASNTPDVGNSAEWVSPSPTASSF